MLSNEELMEIKGGSVTGALVSALVTLMNSIFDLGRSLGSSIKRVVSKKYCKMN